MGDTKGSDMGYLDYHKSRCRKQTSYRSVIGKIISFAENELSELYPDRSRHERIIMAQQEPWWSAAKEVRDLTEDEKNQERTKAIKAVLND